MSATSVRQILVFTSLLLLLCTAVYVQQPQTNNRLTSLIHRVQHSVSRHVDGFYSINNITENLDDDDDDDDDDDNGDNEFSMLKQPITPPESLPSDPYAQYIYQQTLKVGKHHSLSAHKKPRTIVVGDIHGNLVGLDRFLEMSKYDRRRDTVILAGDMVTRGLQSLQVVDKARQLGFKCVRGNHEDKVIRWRGFLDSLSLQEREIVEGGMIEDEVEDINGLSFQIRLQQHIQIPSDLKKNSEHYHLARNMSKAQYNYLRSCPLIYTLPKEISVRGVPVHVIHAGIDPNQGFHKQNPWVLINIRNLLDNGTPSRKKRLGQAWSDVFNDVQQQRSKKRQFLVVYGHDAGRSFNMKTWSIGIDTGCGYNRMLTGYVVETGETISADCSRSSTTQ
ncbi:hypothetical protein BGZ65_003122 [Modicella reniformis]|uniref:Calcineurin-like phosphoesterase domain-containing protein n=1 Tax=Modicella reniformis TaxID=1440133 RepID=A0A9P6IMU8_9FUNG|nr:hypothetical protein BGZ65_003122 [Modicella reniformis]